jgi:activator of 2-hydroxyglutaryl-CoA dehydratase
MILADFGTSYSKFLDLDASSPQPSIVATRELPRDLRVDLATGHNGKRFGSRYVNELTALARGAEALIRDQSYLILDCGSRDIKYVRYRDGQLQDMGWNAECGASMGFTVELLERYYNLDFRKLPVPDKGFSVTCGVLGMSDIFDAITSGTDEAEAVARFVRGIAINAYRFAGSPAKLYLSGGLCDNPLFVKSFPCQVEPLGRFVLLAGLRRILEHNPWRTG